MKVEKVSFSYKGIKPKERLELEHPYLYTSNHIHPDRNKLGLYAILAAIGAVVVTLFNIKR